MSTPAPETLPVQTLTVHPAASFRVSDGVARGEGLGFADDLVMDDVYELLPDAPRLRMLLVPDAGGRLLRVAPGSAAGQDGRLVAIDSCATFMVPDGSTIECLILVEIDGGEAADIWLVPLAPLAPRTDYRLVGLDRHAATTRLAEIACTSFSRGTHITLASGAQVPVEDLRPGDRVLTRDDGPQPIRWIGMTTLRAVGAFAPVVIRKGVLHNENDLVLSPDHRIFIWQRQDRLGAGRSEVLVKVRHLINGETVFQREGGFVDYFQLLFDDHQIIYAEGIAAESLLIDPRTQAALPTEIGRTHGFRRHLAYEVQESLLAGPDAADILRRASQAD